MSFHSYLFAIGKCNEYKLFKKLKFVSFVANLMRIEKLMGNVFGIELFLPTLHRKITLTVIESVFLNING